MTANPVRRAAPPLNTSLRASDITTMNAAGIRNSTASPRTSRESASHSFSHKASKRRISL